MFEYQYLSFLSSRSFLLTVHSTSLLTPILLQRNSHHLSSMDTQDKMENHTQYPDTSDHSSSSLDKQAAPTNSEHLEVIRTVSRVPGNDHYYEKDGLRTYGDNEDHEHEPPMTFNRFMSLLAMAFLWTGSQIPVYLFGEVINPSSEISC